MKISSQNLLIKNKLKLRLREILKTLTLERKRDGKEKPKVVVKSFKARRAKLMNKLQRRPKSPKRLKPNKKVTLSTIASIL